LRRCKDKVFETFFPKISDSNAPNNALISHLGLYNFIYRTYEKNPEKFLDNRVDEILEACKNEFVGFDRDKPEISMSIQVRTCTL
jgi:hypothetical protein